MNSYLCDDGQPIATSSRYLGDDNLEIEVKNRDPRMKQMIFLPNEIMSTTYANNPVSWYFLAPRIFKSGNMQNTTGYRLRKGTARSVRSWNLDDWAYPTYRFAEVLLIYAEARAELNELNQDDVDITINQLRDRVGMAHWTIGDISDPNWDFPTLGEQINEVRRERRIELANEGFRRDDIFRWAAADELIVGKRPTGMKFHREYYSTYRISPFCSDQNGDGVINEADQKIAKWNDLQFLPPFKDAQIDKFEAERVNEEGYHDFFKPWLPDGYQFNLERDYLLPVPKLERTLNPKLSQNPGWDLLE